MKCNIPEGQMSLFDIELPPYPNETEAGTRVNDMASVSRKTQSLAEVPDDEFKTLHSYQDSNSSVNEIMKIIEKGSYRVSAHEFVSDVFECGAIAISNKFDYRNADKREKKYCSIMKKHDKTTQLLIAEAFAKIYVLLTHQINSSRGFFDYLGEIYMRSETSNSKAGQFFTPYSLSRLSADVTIEEAKVKDAIDKDRILTLCEPSCGSGGMVLATADILYFRHHFNIARNLFVQCSDIDSRCVHMCYLQLGLAGIPAVIYRQNTLTLETWERWDTPAYIMQYSRFRDLGDNFM